MISPIERMIDRSSNMKCTKCGQPFGCACWEKCECGWSFEAGKTCRNPKHVIVDASEKLAASIATDVINDLASMKKLDPRFRVTLSNLIEKRAKEHLLIVYETIDDTRPSKRK